VARPASVQAKGEPAAIVPATTQIPQAVIPTEIRYATAVSISVLQVWAENCSFRWLKIERCKRLLSRRNVFDLLHSAEQFVTPDPRRCAASFLAQTFYARGWRLIKAIYLIERNLVHRAAPLSSRYGERAATLGRACVVQHRRDDEQHKKDRQQHWGYQPLTKIE
jgi:hypothetical protein